MAASGLTGGIWLEFDQDQNRSRRLEHDAAPRQGGVLMTKVIARPPAIPQFRLDAAQAPDAIPYLQRLEP